MFDKETESVWLQVGGRAIKGTMLGSRLTSAPVTNTTWKQWKKLNPKTLVMSPDTPYVRFYTPRGKNLERGTPNGFPAPYFRTSMVRGDKRLNPWEMTLGVIMPLEEKPSAPDGILKARYQCYPFSELKKTTGVINDELEKKPIAIFFDAENQTANAFLRQIEGKTLTFEAKKNADGDMVYTDKETKTEWNLEGLGTAGTLKGKSLTRLDSHLSEWYGWVAYFPDTTIYGRSDPPEPLDLLLPETGTKPKGEEKKP